MSVEEIIKKKEERKEKCKKILKKVVIPLVLIVLVVSIICYLVASGKIFNNKLGTNEVNQQNIVTSDNEVQEDSPENQIYGLQNGTSEVSYKGYTYNNYYDETDQTYKIYKNKNGTKSPVAIITYKNTSGFQNFEIWIYKDRLYTQQDGSLKSYNLDGTEEQEIISSETRRSYYLDFDGDMALYTKDDSKGNTYFVVAKLSTGETLKSISQNEFKGYFSEVLNVDKDNIYFYTSETGENVSYSSEMYSLHIYMLSKQDYNLSKIVTEQTLYGWYGCGVYQLEAYGDYIYYVAGSQEGTGGFFNGSLYRVKKDGTGREDLCSTTSEGTYNFGELELPRFLIKNDFLYYEKVRINLKTLERTKDYYSNGDVIDDDDFVYTVSSSDQEKVILSKYKAGTEDFAKIFERDIPDGVSANKENISLKLEGVYIYITITYTDYDNTTEGRKSWSGAKYLTETFRMKKDGSELTEM